MFKSKANIESLHRKAIKALGADFSYFKDIAIEPRIRPLVKLLNNQWTFTTGSCEGHWRLAGRCDSPYVGYQLIKPNDEQWLVIINEFKKTINDQLRGPVSLEFLDTTVLPHKGLTTTALHIGLTQWRRQRWNHKGCYISEKRFRQYHDKVIAITCSCLRKAITKLFSKGLSHEK